MDVKGFYSEATEIALEGFKRLNDTSEVERKSWDAALGSWDVTVVRGKVLEKAALSRIQLKAKHPETGEDTRFDVIQAHVYPASPKIPILLFIVEHVAAKEERFAGILDVACAAAREEDVDFLGTETGKLAEKHGADYEALRERAATMYKLDQWEKAVNAGVGIFLGPDKELFDLIREAGVWWLKSYFSIVEKRKDEPYDSEDVARMNSARAGMLEYCLLGERAIGVAREAGVSLEAVTLGLLAPTIRY